MIRLPVFSSGESSIELLSPYYKFKIVAATTSSSFVHIKTVYNNKYLVRSTNDNYWIWAGADEINEDKRSWTCTLFEILNTNEKPNYVRICHVQLGCYLSLWSASAFYTYGLFAASPNIDADSRDQVEWTDTSCWFVLPKFISFKNPSGVLLSAKVIDNLNLHPFSSNNIEDETVMFETFAKAWGGYNIQSSYFELYWDWSPDGFYRAWIVSDRINPDLSGGGSNFWVLEAGENDSVVIQTYNDKYYCKQYSSGNKTNCLYALNTTTFEEAKLQVVETISTRCIYSVEYRQSDARYYDKNEVFLGKKSATNTTANSIETSFTFTHSFSTTVWTSNSRKVFKEVDLEAELPQIPNAKEKNISQQYNWGEAITTTHENPYTFSVTVPPNSTININFYAFHTSADIPFMYSQDDTLLNGNKVTTQFDDGLFTVINFVDFNYQIE